MKILIVSDIHAPYHNSKAIESTIAIIKKEKPDYLINLGDVVDYDIISKFKDTSTGHALGSTVLMQSEVAANILEGMYLTAKKANKKCKAVFIEGNHETRLDNYLLKRRALMGVTDVGRLLKLYTGYTHIPFGKSFKLGGFLFIHGFYCGVSAAKKHLDMLKGNVVYGHLHTPSTYFGASYQGVKPVAYGIGCLSEIDMDYMKGKPNNCVNSIGLLEIDGKKHQFKHILV